MFANQVFVSTVYQQFLGRPADPAGFFIFTTQLDMGATPQQIIQEIFASPEFQARRAATLATTGLGTMFPGTLSGSAFFTPFAATTFPTVFSSSSAFGSVPFASEFAGGSVFGTTFPGFLFPSPTFRGAFASGFPSAF